ncbi:hypothetical protein [Rhizobium sp. GR12]|uniref:hypothetical protein n=1 Tax=Rhizobium sp. GR12 TaxID=3053925 RepID=UPI003FA7A7DE
MELLLGAKPFRRSTRTLSLTHEGDAFYGVLICGPRPSVAALITGLLKARAHPDRVHYEFFGPADDLIAAA